MKYLTLELAQRFPWRGCRQAQTLPSSDLVRQKGYSPLQDKVKP